MWPFGKTADSSVSEAPCGKVEIFSRHCFFSSISQHKKRLPGFSREACYRNLLDTVDFKRARLTFLLDTAKGTDHFLREEKEHPVIEINEGSEAGSFLRLLDRVEAMNPHPETVLYFVEDDYLHREGWLDVLLEGIQLPGVDYVTLYDHRDKYFLPMYKNLQSRVFASRSCHWRTVPSTTQTFAVRWKRLKQDLSIHRSFSKGREISADHEKFCKLTKRGATLISSMPGWATHMELEFASPCIDWDTIICSKREGV